VELAAQAVADGLVEAVSASTVRRVVGPTSQAAAGAHATTTQPSPSRPHKSISPQSKFSLGPFSHQLNLGGAGKGQLAQPRIGEQSTKDAGRLLVSTLTTPGDHGVGERACQQQAEEAVSSAGLSSVVAAGGAPILFPS
jgi:hypothetical protein